MPARALKIASLWLFTFFLLHPTLAIAQTWQTASSNPGNDNYVQLNYPVVFTTVKIVETPNGQGGVTGDYSTGADVLTANDPSPGNELWITFPNGITKKIFPLNIHQPQTETPAGELWKGSVVEPNISEDGKKVYFTWFHDQTFRPTSGDPRLPYKGADLYRLDLSNLLVNPNLDPASLPLKRMTTRQMESNGLQTWDSRHQDAMNPNLALTLHNSKTVWGTVYMHGIEFRTQKGLQFMYASDKRRLDNSNHGQSSRNLNFNLFIADLAEDGSLSNHKQFHYYTTTSAMSPTPLREGVAFSYQSTQNGMRVWDAHGSNSEGKWYPIWGYGTSPLLAHLFSFCVKTTGANQGDYLAITKYYNQNNDSFGTLYMQDLSKAGINEHIYRSGGYLVPTQVGSYKLTTGTEERDSMSPFIGGQYLGKFTSPRCALPNTMLFAYTPTSANEKTGFDNFGNHEHYRSYIGYRPNLEPFYALDPVNVSSQTGIRAVIKDSSDSTILLWPTPVLSWQARTGDAQQRHSDSIIDPNNGILPGDPHSIVGTSALYNTDRKPYDCYERINHGTGIPHPFHPKKSGNINGRKDNLDSNQDALTYVKDYNDPCLPLDPAKVLGIAVQLTSNKTNTNGAGFGYEMENGQGEVSTLLGIHSILNQSDQSFTAKIPANNPFEFHLLDRDWGLKLVDVRSWHSLKPRETRTDCGGCHNHEANAGIPFAGKEAETAPPTDMLNSTTYIDYNANCQPVLQTSNTSAQRLPEWKSDIWPKLNQHCASCHFISNPEEPTNLATHAFAFNNEQSAYDQLKDKDYVNPILGARGSPLMWVLLNQRIDGRNNDYPTYAPNHAGDDHGFKLSATHMSGPIFCDGSSQELASWVYDVGRWIDNYIPRDTGASYGTKLDWYLPSVDAALTTSSCNPTELAIGIWDDSSHPGSSSTLTMSLYLNGVLAGSPIENLHNGRATIPLPALSSSDRIKVVVEDATGNRSLYEKSIDDFMIECANSNGSSSSSSSSSSSTSSSSTSSGSSSSSSSGSSSSTSSSSSSSSSGNNGSGNGPLVSPSFIGWNTYLDQMNILELLNNGASNEVVLVEFLNNSGTTIHSLNAVLEPNKQQDIVLNSIPSIPKDAYGQVKLSFTQAASIRGRLSFYRNSQHSSTSQNKYDYAYTNEIRNPLRGDTIVGVNTFQPSTNPAESNNAVYNWLGISNLTANTQSFSINRRALDGTLLATANLTLAPWSRSDVHGAPFEINFAGALEIIPNDKNADYDATLIRYGSNKPFGTQADAYSFAFGIRAQQATSGVQWLPISRGGGAQNWVELINSSNTSAQLSLTLYDNFGNVAGSPSIAIPANGQVHFDASAYLSTNASGVAHIAPGAANIIAQSMSYYRNNSGSIQAMYGFNGGDDQSGDLAGSWNLFLEMYNWLRVFNVGSSPQQITVTTYTAGNASQQNVVTIPALSGLDLGLHESQYGTSANQLGVVTVSGDDLITSLIRLKPMNSNDGNIDFAFPTRVGQ